MPEALVWKGVEVEKLGQLVDAIGDLESREEAEAFMVAYRAVEPFYADQNAGYVTGYFDGDRAQQLREWLGTPHPIFGMKAAPSPAVAIEAGKRAALGEFSP